MKEIKNQECAAMSSPIRWAGSKRKLIPAIRANMPSDYRRYMEPFCGSLSLYLALPKKQAVLSDLNAELIHFYRMARWRPRVVWSAAQGWDLSPETYYEVRSLHPESLCAERRAARFLYLNRLCFNGVYRTNSRGEFNVPRGSRVPGMPEKEAILLLASRLRSAELICDDFSEIVNLARRNDFLYLDPPYAGRGVRNRGEYGPGSFDVSDIERLQVCIDRASRRGAKILISYADVEVIKDAFHGWNVVNIKVPRNVSGFASGRGIAGEVFLKNY